MAKTGQKNRAKPRGRSLAERFEVMVDRRPGHGPRGDCHVWTGASGGAGHGQVWAEGRARGAHVVAFFLANGRWPHPCCLHTCDYPPCVRSDHLHEGTQAENLAEMARRGRARARWGVRLTDDQVRQVRLDPRPQRVIAREYDVSQAQIGAIKTGRNRRYVDGR